MENDPAAADELPERKCVCQATMFPESKQAVGDCVGNEEKQHAKATVQIENARELPGDRIDHQIGQMVVDERESVHGERVFVKGQWSWPVACRPLRRRPDRRKTLCRCSAMPTSVRFSNRRDIICQ
ncbi:hypothetical protein FQZ97_815010 [compost metagenome]